MKTQPEILLLFDIDGTLTASEDFTGKFLHEITTSYFSLSNPQPLEVPFSGNTDSFNLRQYLAALKLSEAELACHLPAIASRFDERSVAHLASVKLNPLVGAVELLQKLATNKHYLLGTLTGNTQARGRAKLQSSGLEKFFSFFLFGGDYLSRLDLPAIAQEKARLERGYLFPPEKMVIIGDTPNDIKCAKLFGAHSIAVATGSFSRHELAGLEPSLLINDLQEGQADFIQYLERIKRDESGR